MATSPKATAAAPKTTWGAEYGMAKEKMARMPTTSAVIAGRVPLLRAAIRTTRPKTSPPRTRPFDDCCDRNSQEGAPAFPVFDDEVPEEHAGRDDAADGDDSDLRLTGESFRMPIWS